MLRTLRLSRVLATARSLSTAPSKLPVVEVRGWDVARVVEFAKSESVGLDDEDANILLANKVNGKRLLNLTEDKLRADGMARGPASDLAAAIAKLHDARE